MTEFGVPWGEELGTAIPERSASEVAGAEAGVADEFKQLGAETGVGGVFDEGFCVVLSVFEFAFGEGFMGLGVGGGGVLGGQRGGGGKQQSEQCDDLGREGIGASQRVRSEGIQVAEDIAAFFGGKWGGGGSGAGEVVVGVAFEQSGELRAVLGLGCGGDQEKLRGAAEEFLVRQ